MGERKDAPVVVVGAGPVGCVLAQLLARRGWPVEVYEARPDMRARDIAAGRSINLVLTARGLRALKLLGLEEQVLALTVPVIGRMMHSLEGELTFQPYGKDRSECNYSISRGELNAFLLDQAEAAGATIHFERKLVAADLGALRLEFVAGARRETVEAARVFGCDGAPSAVRTALAARPGYEATQTMLEHGYKELTFPAAPAGGFAMDGESLHIWPRTQHFLMGLPNQDGSFTGTVYLPWEGPAGFASLSDAAAVRDFFQTHYPDSLPLLPELEAEFLANPTGHLGTVRSYPWHLEDKVLLVGDAAHAIVPFFGQGLNCGFEDCAILAGMLGPEPGDLGELFARFSAERKPDTEAIADMALENFVEMRDKVGDPAFILRKRVEARVQEAFTAKYRSRYAMVMYSSIPYGVAFEAGRIQSEILGELCRDIAAPEEVDLARAEQLIDAQLSPFLAERGVTLDF